ncbi:MAG: zinc ribbon domain-containing protein [Firmicutes bacterium]|nr:zinc ribbon domain-containing protein [Bacillota bacterium]
MECIKCQTKNINKANFCKKCGYHFSKAEQDSAKKGTFVWVLEKVNDLKSILDLSFITENIIFRILTIILILGIGIYSWITNGINIKLLENPNYKIQYNTKLDEYYLLVDSNKTTLDLYIPNRTNQLVIKHLDENNQLLFEKDYQIEEKIVLESTSSNDYYLLEAKYQNNKQEKIKIYIYKEGSVDVE